MNPKTERKIDRNYVFPPINKSYIGGMGKPQLWKGYIIFVGPNFSLLSKIQIELWNQIKNALNWCESHYFTQKYCIYGLSKEKIQTKN